MNSIAKALSIGIAIAGSAAFAAVPYKLGVAGFTYHAQPIDRALGAMKKMDVHYLCIKDFHCDYGKGAGAPIADFKAKCAAAGVTCLGAGPLYYSSEAEARKLFEFARAYGIDVVVVVPFEAAKKADGAVYKAESEAMLDVLEKLVREFDTKAAIHNHGPDMPELYPTAEAIWARIEKRDPRIGICLDVGHQRRAGGDPVDAIRKYGSRIYDVHLKNIKIDARKNVAVPAPRGELDIPAIMKALALAGYSGVCHIEYERDYKDNFAGLLESVGYYRGVMDAIKVPAVMKPAPKDANTLSDAEKAEGWKLVWDGKTLDGWVSVNSRCKTKPKKGWYIKDRTLTMRPTSAISDGKWVPLPPEDRKLGGGGDIVTVERYGDFAFKFDFRMTEAANSGVKYFYNEHLDKGTCEEYQILEMGHPGFGKGRNGVWDTAALYDIFPATGVSELLKGPGEWNSGMIVSKGAHVEHWLNGKKVLEYERGSKAFRDAVKDSKFCTWGRDASGKPCAWGENPTGRILLQDHGDSTVSFCNLKVKSLAVAKP